ncbi:MAG: hypothetical protein JOZ17_14030 [Acetobacteraceae bacterium]|nr:hypothetical protein [Acetobacteraceae bacterium]
MVRLALTWVREAHSSYRGVALIFSSLQGVVVAVGPCAETIRLWLLRVGLFLLQRPLPRCSDWVFLVDLTIQLGEHQCRVILGVRLPVLRSKGYSPDPHDVEVLSVAVLTRCNGETVAAHLGPLSNRPGVPVQVVSDHGSDVRAGIRWFPRKQGDHHQRVVATYDITHGLALLLKNQLEPDAHWASFVQACQSTRQQLQRTAGSFLKPPAWRSKARFLNLESHSKWADEMLVLLEGAEVATLAEHLGQGVAEARKWLEEELGWLRAYAREVRAWSYFQRVVQVAEQEIKEAGLSRTSWRRVKDRLDGESPPAGVEKAFRGRVLAFVREEGAQVPARQKYLGSSDVLESLFGKYKDLAAPAPCREITAKVLMIPLLVTSLTADLLRQALETVRAQDVEEWLDEHRGPSPQKKKRAVLTAARSSNRNEGPKPA